jgi:hypothetical protein
MTSAPLNDLRFSDGVTTAQTGEAVRAGDALRHELDQRSSTCAQQAGTFDKQVQTMRRAAAGDQPRPALRSPLPVARMERVLSDATGPRAAANA